MPDVNTLSVDTFTGVAAFLQKLQGGKPVDEETLALRMLATLNADADFDTSHIKSLSASQGGGPKGAAAMPSSIGTKDRFDDFMDAMLGDTKTPEEQIEDGKAPKPPPVIVEDVIADGSGYSKEEALPNFALLQDAHSICQLYMNMLVMQSNPEGFDITKDAAAAFNVQAKMAYNAMAGPLAGYYNFSEGSHTRHSFTIKQDQVHEKLLETMFDGMRLDKDHKTQIDSQISAYVKALKNITINGSPSTMDFTLRFGLCPAVNITADDSNQIWAFTPTTYLIYLKMNTTAFKQSISKRNSQDMINLVYEHTVTKFELNAGKFRRDREKFDKMFEQATNMSLKQYGDLLNKKVQKD